MQFWVHPVMHFKSGLLLGKTADVRFTPTKTLWRFDDGSERVGDRVSQVFSSAGAIEASAEVTYSVSYQIAGTSGWQASGEIQVADSLSIAVVDTDGEVIAAPEVPSKKSLRLVARNCLQQRGKFGCTG